MSVVICMKIQDTIYLFTYIITLKLQKIKNLMMELYKIPLLTFKTNGIGERERIAGMLDKLVG